MYLIKLYSTVAEQLLICVNPLNESDDLSTKIPRCLHLSIALTLSGPGVFPWCPLLTTPLFLSLSHSPGWDQKSSPILSSAQLLAVRIFYLPTRTNWVLVPRSYLSVDVLLLTGFFFFCIQYSVYSIYSKQRTPGFCPFALSLTVCVKYLSFVKQVSLPTLDDHKRHLSL